MSNSTNKFYCDCDCAVCDLGDHHRCRHAADCNLGTPTAISAFAKQAKVLVHA